MQEHVHGSRGLGVPIERTFRQTGPPAGLGDAENQLLVPEVDRVAWLIGGTG
jgi:hypothetical protein